MKVIVDTCVWSLALRRNNNSNNDPHLCELRTLIEESRVQMLGVIRQELLSGIVSTSQFKKLQTQLLAFPDMTILTEDHERAAEFFNLCRAKGIQGSAIDFLICAASSRYQYAIFTSDNDFVAYSKILPIKLYSFRSE